MTLSALALLCVYAVSVVAFVLFAADKRRAMDADGDGRRRRIPEKTLLLLSLAGGAPGSLCAMLIFNHKTRKPAFRFGVPAMLALQAAAALTLYSLAL